MDAKKIFSFLTTLKSNNKKMWFDENRKTYLECRADFVALAQKVLVEISDFHPDFFHQDPRKCLFRINRDVRFSKNKNPYKTNLGAYFVPNGKKSDNSGFYIHVEPGNCFLAAGHYQPENRLLAKIRTAIDAKSDQFLSIVEDKKLKNGTIFIRDNSLKNPPRGFKKEHPMIEYLKLKTFVWVQPVPDNFFAAENLEQKIFETFSHMRPLVDFLNQAVAQPDDK